MANISGASLEGIQERLQGIPNYHPLEANTFSDWSVEAGDIVKVMRGSTAYESPIHSTRLVWKGAPEMAISSTGNKERDPVAKVSRKKYGRGGAAVRSEEKIYRTFTSSDGLLWSAIYMSESMLYTHFDNAISDVHSTILQTAGQIYSTVYASDSQLYSYIDQTATYIRQDMASVESGLRSSITQTANGIRTDVSAANSTLYSYVNQTATGIRQQVNNTASSLQSSIDQQADKISLVVEGTGANAHVSRAAIVGAINNGQSTVTISADSIDIDGLVNQLRSHNVVVEDLVTLGQADFIGETFHTNITCEQTVDTSQLVAHYNVTVDGHELRVSNITKSQDNQTITVYFTDGTSWSFSKPTSIENLTGSWGGSFLTVSTEPDSGKTYTVGFPSGSSYPYNENLFIDWDSSRSMEVVNANINVPVKVVSRTGQSGGTTRGTGYASVVNALDTTYAFSSNKITANGTYEPAEGKVGFNKIVVDVQGGGEPVDYRLLPVWDANQPNKLTISRTENQSYGTSYTLYVMAGIDDLTYNSTTHKYSTTAHAKAGTSTSSATDRNTASKTSGTEAYEDGWAGCNETVGIRRAGSVATGELAPGQSTYFYAISSATPGAAQTDKAGMGVSAKTDANLTAGNIKNGVTIFGITGTYNPTVTIGSWQLNYQANTNYTYKAKVQVNGTWYESENLSAANAYDNGWSACTGSVGISPSSAQTLNPGGEVTVYAQAKASSGAQSKTSYASVKVKAAAISTSDWSLAYQSGTNNTYKASVKVNGATYTSGNLYATDAYTNGQDAAGVSGVWDGNELTVSRLVSSSTKTLTYTVTAGASIAYNSSTHKYTATGTASAGGAQRQSKTATSGTEAYDAGYQVTDISVSYTGTSSGSKRYTKTSGSGSTANCSMQVILSCHGYSETNTWTAPVTYAYRDGYSAGYTAGYNDGSGTSPSVSFGSLGQYSTKQTSGITRNYSASAGYKYFVVPITVNGTTYKAQIYHMTS